ncbi:MAG: amylo-alpha-1,6-glucosidase [Nanobdellota archaeon]
MSRHKKEEKIEEGYRKAVDVLRKNQSKYGFSASTERKENYYSVWARDHCITSIGAILTGDEDLIETAETGIFFLLRNQIDHGQVPSYVEIENKKKVYGGFGSITSVDSNLWIVIACAIMHKRTKNKTFLSKTNMLRYRRFYRLFKAFDSNNCGLMEVPTAGDWADVMNRSYHVLYDECLYYEALKALIYLFERGYEKTKDEDIRKRIRKRIRWIRLRKPKVKKRINQVFWFTKDNIKDIKDEYMIMENIEEKTYSYYQSHLKPFKIHWEWRFDSLGNILAIVTDIANKKKKRMIINHALRNKVNKPYPIKALHPPVYKHERGWEYVYEKKEQTHTYHNGGLWPMIAGFWIYALDKIGYTNKAEEELYKLAELLEKNNWDFNEYMHGQTADSKGKKEQAWSASAYILAYKSIKEDFNIFNFR